MAKLAASMGNGPELYTATTEGARRATSNNSEDKLQQHAVRESSASPDLSKFEEQDDSEYPLSPNRIRENFKKTLGRPDVMVYLVGAHMVW